MIRFAYLMNPPCWHFRFASVPLGKSISGRYSMSTKTDSSASTSGFR